MTQSTNEWQACQPGHLNRIVRKLQNRRLVRALKRDVAVGTVLVACVLSSYVGIDAWANQPANLGGIVCFEVSKLQNLIARHIELPPEVEVCLNRHLELCAHCRAKVEMARAQHDQAKLPLGETAQPAENHAAASGTQSASVLANVGY